MNRILVSTIFVLSCSILLFSSSVLADALDNAYNKAADAYNQQQNDGDITPEQYDQKMKELKEKIENIRAKQKARQEADEGDAPDGVTAGGDDDVDWGGFDDAEETGEEEAEAPKPKDDKGGKDKKDAKPEKPKTPEEIAIDNAEQADQDVKDAKDEVKDAAQELKDAKDALKKAENTVDAAEDAETDAMNKHGITSQEDKDASAKLKDAKKKLREAKKRLKEAKQRKKDAKGGPARARSATKKAYAAFRNLWKIDSWEKKYGKKTSWKKWKKKYKMKVRVGGEVIGTGKTTISSAGETTVDCFSSLALVANEMGETQLVNTVAMDPEDFADITDRVALPTFHLFNQAQGQVIASYPMGAGYQTDIISPSTTGTYQVYADFPRGMTGGAVGAALGVAALISTFNAQEGTPANLVTLKNSRASVGLLSALNNNELSADAGDAMADQWSTYMTKGHDIKIDIKGGVQSAPIDAVTAGNTYGTPITVGDAEAFRDLASADFGVIEISARPFDIGLGLKDEPKDKKVRLRGSENWRNYKAKQKAKAALQAAVGAAHGALMVSGTTDPRHINKFNRALEIAREDYFEAVGEIISKEAWEAYREDKEAAKLIFEADIKPAKLDLSHRLEIDENAYKKGSVILIYAKNKSKKDYKDAIAESKKKYKAALAKAKEKYMDSLPPTYRALEEIMEEEKLKQLLERGLIVMKEDITPDNVFIEPGPYALVAFQAGSGKTGFTLEGTSFGAKFFETKSSGSISDICPTYGVPLGGPCL